MAEPHRHAVLRQVGERRLDQGRAQAVAGDQRPAGGAAGGERLANHRAGELGGAERRRDVERRQQQRLDQARIEGPAAGDDLADRLAGAREQERGELEIIERGGTGHPHGGIEDPPRHAARIHAQGPALAALEIDEIEGGGGRDRQLRCGADVAQETECRTIARQQQMIAVVDGHAERGIVIGAAAAARERGGLVHHDLPAAFSQRHRGGEPGEAGTDDVDGRRHSDHGVTQHDPQAARARDTRIGWRGGAKPRAVSWSRIEP